MSTSSPPSVLSTVARSCTCNTRPSKLPIFTSSPTRNGRSMSSSTPAANCLTMSCSAKPIIMPKMPSPAMKLSTAPLKFSRSSTSSMPSATTAKRAARPNRSMISGGACERSEKWRTKLWLRRERMIVNSRMIAIAIRLGKNCTVRVYQSVSKTNLSLQTSLDDIIYPSDKHLTSMRSKAILRAVSELPRRKPFYRRVSVLLPIAALPLGAHFVRMQLPWEDVEIHAKGDFQDRRNAQAVHSAWDKYDFIFGEMRRLGLEPIVRIDRPPAWARAQAKQTPEFKARLAVNGYAIGPPDNYADYAD